MAKREKIWSAFAEKGKVRLGLKLKKLDGRLFGAYVDLSPSDAIALGQKLQDEASIARDPS
jgi:hypothetical protein